jgi:hypothetical protein
MVMTNPEQHTCSTAVVRSLAIISHPSVRRCIVLVLSSLGTESRNYVVGSVITYIIASTLQRSQVTSSLSACGRCYYNL